MKTPNRQKTLEVFLVFALAGLVGWWVCQKKWPHHDSRWLLQATGGLILLGLLFKGLAARLAAAWLAFGEALGKVMSVLMLAAVFFLMLTPLAWLYRRFTRNPLLLKRLADPSRSYYTRRDHDYQPEDLENPW